VPMIIIKTPEQIRALIELGKRHKEVLQAIEAAAVPGATTDELEAVALREIARYGAVPAFKGYQPPGARRPFPCALCVAPNDVVVHGIPTEMHYTLQDGDIIGIDVGLKKDGVITDAGYTVPVGNVAADIAALLTTTREALEAGVQQARAGNHIGDIGAAISARAKKGHYGVVRELAGHGVGVLVHEEPYVPNYGKQGRGETLRAGMVLAIEPMCNMGDAAVDFLPDGYTVRTRDGSLSAHFEHNVVVTEGEPVVIV
jgi:methionyl aminopeptidase